MESELLDSDYQVMLNGKAIPITELTREQLIKELRHTMDRLEVLDEILGKAADQIRMWRFGRV